MGVSAYEALVKSDGPLHYYRFGEVPDQVLASDEVGNNDGSYTTPDMKGSPGAIVGDPDTAITLDGVDAYVGIPGVFDTTGATQWSVELWVKPTVDTGTNRFI